MQWAGRPAAPVVQALDWLGPDAAGDAQVVAMLRRSLPDDLKHDLEQNISDVPGWAAPLVRSIVADQKPAACTARTGRVSPVRLSNRTLFGKNMQTTFLNTLLLGRIQR